MGDVISNMISNYYSGSSGLLLPVPNKLHYPEAFQDKPRMAYYGALYNSIEVNSSFYKIPRAVTLQKWATLVPENFEFSFKLFKGISHSKGLDFEPQVVADYMSALNGVGDKKGCLLLQFPPSIGHQLDKIHALLSIVQEHNLGKRWKVAVEFRNNVLYQPEVYTLLAEHDAGMVLHDKQAAPSPLLDTHPDFVYLRFHGPDGNYRSSYDETILAEYASYIIDWMAQGKKVYAYFNNTMGSALENLQCLRSLVKSEG
ncbi:DUF72 domain-containing protein [Pedobacter sp. Leaf132]|uniref:DUF72 domain-containing protein n=1 Tax=Pedobacter sp. Leaf132 TaxID=2876557 RepID=UPI001E2FEC24|nr:DUF72 domain-containing protein [Pedobacter sp. Leaf132]